MREFALTPSKYWVRTPKGRTFDEMRSSRSSFYLWIGGGFARGYPGSVVTLIDARDDPRGDLHQIVDVALLLVGRVQYATWCSSCRILGGLAPDKNARYSL